jgi:hypothetical protein
MAQAYSNRNPDVAKALAGILTQQAPAYQQADLEMAKDIDNRFKVDTLAKMQERIEQGNDPMRKAQLMSLTNSVLGTTLDPKSLQFQYSMMDDIMKMKISALIAQANENQAYAPNTSSNNQYNLIHKDAISKDGTKGITVADNAKIGEDNQKFSDAIKAIDPKTSSLNDIWTAITKARNFYRNVDPSHLYIESEGIINDAMVKQSTYNPNPLQLNKAFLEQQRNLFGDNAKMRLINPNTRKLEFFKNHNDALWQQNEWDKEKLESNKTTIEHQQKAIEDKVSKYGGMK